MPGLPGLVWTEKLPDDATAGDAQTIEVLREVVRGHMRKIDGVIVDATTTAAILTVYDALKPPTRAKLAALDIGRMAQVAWRLRRNVVVRVGGRRAHPRVRANPDRPPHPSPGHRAQQAASRGGCASDRNSMRPH